MAAGDKIIVLSSVLKTSEGEVVEALTRAEQVKDISIFDEIRQWS